MQMEMLRNYEEKEKPYFLELIEAIDNVCS